MMKIDNERPPPSLLPPSNGKWRERKRRKKNMAAHFEERIITAINKRITRNIKHRDHREETERAAKSSCSIVDCGMAEENQ